jgi:hypothetical protein
MDARGKKDNYTRLSSFLAVFFVFSVFSNFSKCNCFPFPRPHALVIDMIVSCFSRHNMRCQLKAPCYSSVDYGGALNDEGVRNVQR